MNSMTKKEKAATIIGGVLLVVATIALIFVANHQRSQIARENDAKTTEASASISDPTIYDETEETEIDPAEEYLMKKEEAQKKSLTDFKNELKTVIEEDNFSSPEAEKFLNRYINAPIEDNRDNFFMSEEEWNAYDCFCEETYFVSGEVYLTEHILLSVDGSELNRQLSILDDNENIVSYRLFSWD